MKDVQRQAVGRFPMIGLFEEIMGFSSAEVKMSITVIIRRNTARDVFFMSAFCSAPANSGMLYSTGKQKAVRLFY